MATTGWDCLAATAREKEEERKTRKRLRLRRREEEEAAAAVLLFLLERLPFGPCFGLFARSAGDKVTLGGHVKASGKVGARIERQGLFQP